VSSPTTRSLALLRSEGFAAEKVEYRRAFQGGLRGGKLVDLFGFIDLVAVGRGMTIGCQTTSYANLASRVVKIRQSEHLAALDEAGWSVIAHGWRRKGGLWVVREVVVLPGRPVYGPIVDCLGS
jgi:hypothetical protein